MLHPRTLLNLHRREDAQRMAPVADDLERRGRIAPEHAPASLQFLAHGSLQRMAVSVEILAGRDNIAVERRRLCAVEQRQRIGPAVEIGRHLAQANEIGTARHPPQRSQQIAPQRASRPASRGAAGPEHRRVVVGQIEIGELNDPDAVLQPPNQRQQGDTLADVTASEITAISGSTSSTWANASYQASSQRGS